MKFIKTNTRQELEYGIIKDILIRTMGVMFINKFLRKIKSNLQKNNNF